MQELTNYLVDEQKVDIDYQNTAKKQLDMLLDYHHYQKLLFLLKKRGFNCWRQKILNEKIISSSPYVDGSYCEEKETILKKLFWKQ